MYTKSSLLLSVVAIGLFTSNSIIAKQQTFFVTAHPKMTTAYWTAERMQHATSMELPKANVTQKLSQQVLWNRNKNDKPDIIASATPTVQVTPKQHLLFEPIDQDQSVHHLDAGTLNEQFTSSQLTPQSADQSYPYTTVGKLFLTTPTGNKTCSAAVIAKRLVLTAGHCVHSGNGSSTGWYSNWVFVPAFRNGNAPFQTWTASSASITGTWYSGGGTVPNAQDYAILEIEDQVINGVQQSIGSVVGQLGFQTLSTIPNHAHLLGYPGNLDSGQIMHQVTAQSAQAVAPNNAEYGSDMGLGSGGGPWIQNFGAASQGQTGGTNPARNMIIGLSSYGYDKATTLAEGSPILDAAFTGLYTIACSRQSGNC